MVLVLMGLAGGLLAVGVRSALVAAHSIEVTRRFDSDLTAAQGWLSPGAPDTPLRGEPQPPCDRSRPRPRAVATVPGPTPANPPRRDRRNPSAGWARLYRHHSPHRSSRLGGSPTVPPHEQAGEQWSWD